jgi:hypothetical protein
MKNYFYDVLPDDIKTYIYQIRLAKQVEKIYCAKIMQQNVFIDFIYNNHIYKNVLFYQNINTNVFSRNKENYSDVCYLNPCTTTSKNLTKILSKVLSFNFYSRLSKNDKITLLIEFIRPLERGLIIYKRQDTSYNLKKIYYKTESYYLDIMMKLKIKIASGIFN